LCHSACSICMLLSLYYLELSILLLRYIAIEEISHKYCRRLSTTWHKTCRLTPHCDKKNAKNSSMRITDHASGLLCGPSVINITASSSVEYEIRYVYNLCTTPVQPFLKHIYGSVFLHVSPIYLMVDLKKK
jgi:hypothetical protein